MALEITCPECGKDVEIENPWGFPRVDCPHCSTPLELHYDESWNGVEEIQHWKNVRCYGVTHFTGGRVWHLLSWGRHLLSHLLSLNALRYLTAQALSIA